MENFKFREAGGGVGDFWTKVPGTKKHTLTPNLVEKKVREKAH